jgi:hypothetical protein
VSVETWVAIIAAFLALMALCISEQSPGTADAARKQPDFEEQVSDDFPRIFVSAGKSEPGSGTTEGLVRARASRA